MYAMIQADLQKDEYELSPAHKKLLDERLEHNSTSGSGSGWEEVKSRIISRL